MNRDEGYRVQRDAMREHYPRFSAAEYERRYGLLRSMMDGEGLDCLLIYGDSGCGFLNQLAVHWLSNYMTQVGQDGATPLHRRGTELIVK